MAFGAAKSVQFIDMCPDFRGSRVERFHCYSVISPGCTLSCVRVWRPSSRLLLLEEGEGLGSRRPLLLWTHYSSRLTRPQRYTHTHTHTHTLSHTQVIVYRIAGKFDGELNLANWRFWTATAKVYSCQIYDLRTVMLPSASHRQI